jgi:TetR/AcrR family transcriptional repressor of nem operon
MADTNRPLREACHECFADWTEGLRADLQQAKSLYAPRARFDPRSLAEHCIAVLEGAIILAKTSREPRTLADSLMHLKRYLTLLFNHKL